MVRITVSTHLWVSIRDLRAAGVDPKAVRDLFSYDNPDYWKKKRMGVWTGETPRRLTLLITEGAMMGIPRGGWPRFRAYLERAKAEVEIVNHTVSGTGPLGMEYETPAGWDLGPDQRSAAKQLVNKRQGIILGPCASGKTEILLKGISDVGERTLVLVHTERILRNWVATAAARFGVRESEIGEWYGKAKRERPLTVGMIRSVLNRLAKEPEWAATWGCVVLDEAHHAPATTFAQTLGHFAARWRIAATATPKRKDGKECLFFDAFGSVWLPPARRDAGPRVGPLVLFEITDEDLDRFGRIMPVDVVVVPTEFRFDLHRQAELARMGVDPNGRSAMATVKAWANAQGFVGPLNTYADMLDAMVRDPHRQARILEYLLPEIQAGRTCLLLADRRELGVQIQAWLRRRKIEAGRLMGGRDSSKQDQTADALEEGTLRAAVGTTVADEGMNLKRLDRGFGCTPVGSNPGRFTQQIGRFKRKHPDKLDAVYYYFWDRGVRSLRGHARAVMNAVKPPHRVWYSERPGEREPLTPALCKKLEGD